MSKVKLADLSPVPFFARFLEGQFSDDLTPEQMRRVCGGSSETTMAAPSDSDYAEINPPVQAWVDVQGLIRRATASLGQLPSLPGLPAPRPSGPARIPSNQERVAHDAYVFAQRSDGLAPASARRHRLAREGHGRRPATIANGRAVNFPPKARKHVHAATAATR